MKFNDYKFNEEELKAIEQIEFYFSEKNVARLFVFLASKLDGVNKRIDKIVDHLES